MKPDPNDAYWEVAVEQYENLLFLYRQFAAKRPVMLFDIQEQKIYAYPYKEFAIELSKKSQASLALQYQVAREDGHMVVFIRDNEARKLISYAMPIKKNRARQPSRRGKTRNISP